MREMMLYPEDYEIAEKNGIGRKTLQNRVYTWGMPREEARTKPLRGGPSKWDQWKDKSLVCHASFYLRIQKGMTPEQAALTPPLRKKREKK